MSKQTMQTKDIACAVEKALADNAPESTALLRRRLWRMTRELRARYTRANGSARRAPEEEWLCDNYYILEKESKQSIRDIKNLEKKARPGELMLLYNVTEKVICDLSPAICDENAAALLSAVGARRPLSERQFSFVATAIKSALITMAWRGCIKSCSEKDIAYAITGLNKLSSLDMESIVSQCSGVEHILLADSAGVYDGMSNESRQHYRYLIAQIARRTGKSEQETATDFLNSAKAESDPAKRHIGYGIVHSEHISGPKRRRGKAALFLGAVLPLLISILLGIWSRSLAVAVLCYLPLWEVLRILIWQVALYAVDMDFLPRMDLTKMESRPKTVVLISMLLPKASETARLAARLEQLYFSNSDPDMYYCILADLGEWDFPSDEKDESQIAASVKVIEALNKRYNDRFMLFLRSRSYNKTQKKYSGWERKRGAITEFIRFLKGKKTSVHTFTGDREVLPDIRYIIALDADTNMLYESAQTLVSIAIHPLCRPVISEDGVVTGGYGILAPKISSDLTSAKATAFSRVMSGCGGMTAYETRDKDFYQDLFSESIFAGKGLIDVDAFYTLLDNRFPENRVLSHDILEGAYLRCAFVSDVEMTDTAPRSMGSWLSRLHRWLRGDWQNLSFIADSFKSAGKTYQNPINSLSKYKLFDNLRRSVTCISSLACMIAALFLPPLPAAIAAISGILAVAFASLWSALWSLVNGGFFTVSRKFFTRTLPHTLELVTQGLFCLIMLPAQTFLSVDAAVRSLWRTYISKGKMLEWTTAAQSDARAAPLLAIIRRFWLAELFGLLYFLLASHTALSLLGLCFALILPVAHYSAKPTPEDGHTLGTADRDTLISYNAAMWRYYEDFANPQNHFLPPDNIQQSPVYRVAARTSPTNIGMLLLSALAARDFDFIDTSGLYLRIERSLCTIEKLAKWNGNLYNWYDTVTLETLKPEFVSTVDSGNFVCCLVALAEGLREFVPERPQFEGLISRIESLIDNTELKPFYDKKRELFSIGYDVPSGKLVDSYYDFLMSEARLTSYYAVARKIVGKKHWGRLGRAMSRQGSYAGSVSWTGTMFEYYMPHLLLPVYEGSLLGEALIYCLYCQKKRAKAAGVPWGISESAFYAFDNNLNYQYKAHGIQKIGMKRYLDRELVISPYSTFITIAQNPNSSMQNLRSLRELGVYGRYGFFEAVDFTQSRVGTGGLAVTRSYMAHHIGMSMIASCNALFENRMQERFMRNHYMKSGDEFLQEKIAKSTVIYDTLKNPQSQNEKQERPRLREERLGIHPEMPRCVLLTNGEITDILTDTGAGYLKFGGIDLTRRGTDLLRRAGGFIALVQMNGRVTPATKAPFYREGVEYKVETQEQSVTYYAKSREVETGMRVAIHPMISCEQRQIAVKNLSGKKGVAQVLLYFEPVLAAYNDYSAHPAYSKLFVTAGYDPDTRTLTFSRRNRDGTQDMFLTAGFLTDIDFTFETKRENLMSAPNGTRDLLNFTGQTFSCNGGGVPDACCAIQFSMTLSAGAENTATLLLCASRTAAEGIAGIISMRGIGVLDEKNAARSALPGDSLEGRLAANILGPLLFPYANANGQARQKSELGQSSLWVSGISGDLPISLIERPSEMDDETIGSYLRLHRILRGLQVEFDLCILSGSEAERERLSALIEKQSVPNILGQRGGVFLLNRDALEPEILILIRAVARHITPLEMLSGDASLKPFTPVRFAPVQPTPMPDVHDSTVNGGAFAGGRFYVDKTSPLPWCHALANSEFGTLVSDKALGFTWAINSRENKLTPWYNDIAADNEGEMCLLFDGEAYHNLVNGARASFSSADVRYQGKTNKLATDIRVTVSGKGCAKYIDVTLRNLTDNTLELKCAYYTEPVLGVNRDTARYILPETSGGALILHNPYNTAVRCYAALCSDSPDTIFATRRADFLCGRWDWSEITPESDPCAAVVTALTLPAKGETRVRFTLSYGATKESALKMARLELGEYKASGNRISIKTPDKQLDVFINHFAAHQILASRIFGRCAFYQCGGAYGFRDQLQDVMSYLLIDPCVAKRQILRCCSAQFEEGDVLHWWHGLPANAGGLKGVRTRFSDDLLWLPLATAEYVVKTGDRDILSLPVRYIRAPELENHEHEKYIAPERSLISEDVYRHCVRAIERGWHIGENGLPLIGCGDWNDGFSAVGTGGQGRSVWLALFLAHVLNEFLKICAIRGDIQRREEYENRAILLKQAVDAHCWDGSWYVRAFYDNGEKMGTHENEECCIDLLPQSFAVISGMPDRDRVDSALESARKRLVDEDLRLVRLFDKPFQHSRQQPGYVKAYPSGIRENGGQYTHSAIWFALALFESGRIDEGFRILEMLNPVNRAGHASLAARYKLEPYYMAADIYTNPNAAGRGGWSMYTGAVSWYYRVVIETLLGLGLEGDKLTLNPKLPSGWDSAEVEAEISGTSLHIRIARGSGHNLVCDGVTAGFIPLDGAEHTAEVTIV